MAEQHAHFICGGCERVFCSQDPRYKGMVEGDACPVCHVATVTVIPSPPDIESLDDMLPEPLRNALSGVVAQFTEQTTGMRVRGLLDVASRLYPYVTAVFPDPADAGQFKAGGEIIENDVARSLRCVEIAFGMERAIRERITLESAKEF